MDTSGFKDGGEDAVEGYGPTEHAIAMRLECLRLAVDVAPQHAVEKAKDFYDFVQGMASIQPPQPK
ncbi:hypothetical protein [Mesorhizobium sp. B2-1-2]|uniref:hypothetical protein n=1 Tax=Mesorhizobium sp. B2-1-2 TaxID=2589973 RepID=UPI00112E790B|nr:hypothetical protein [Mesorhizobium sp. B2-1-2]TPN11707.1 hypothetical protein FJ971_09880 [Mesorhizobium sp. B2-1-2]